MFITPQEGKQSQFLASSADIVLYGGAAGGGKTFGLLLEAVRNVKVKGFGAVFFRKSLKQIEKEGGLWDTAESIYPFIGGRGVKGNLVYHFDRYGTKIQFAYMARDADVREWQGTQIPLICFDELTHFSKRQFFYMLSRNRSVCGVKPYVRATCNPDPDSWVAEFIDWWIGEDGIAIDDRSGVIRWFVNQNDQTFWFDRKIDAAKAFPNIPPKSFTFIKSDISDNKILMEKDPNYIANLEALDAVERARLKEGNWKVRAGAGDYFKRSTFEVIDALPPLKHVVRCWDWAGTMPSVDNPDPDWTVGTKMGITETGEFVVIDVVRVRENPAGVERVLRNTTSQDGKSVTVRIPQDVGSAGKVVAQTYAKMLAGYKTVIKGVTGNKEVRAKPASSQAMIGNIKLLRADWNEAFLTELENFPNGAHDDQVDTLSDCVDELTDWRKPVKTMKKPKQIR